MRRKHFINFCGANVGNLISLRVNEGMILFRQRKITPIRLVKQGRNHVIVVIECLRVQHSRISMLFAEMCTSMKPNVHDV